MGISSAENCDLFWKTVVFTDKNRDSVSKMGMHPLGQTWQFTSKGNWELFLLPLHGLFLELPVWTTDNVTIHALLPVNLRINGSCDMSMCISIAQARAKWGSRSWSAAC
jgi:hypothetical protein